MAYIYKITNNINEKVYIGKTEFSIERRFKQHCSDAQKDIEEQRPLYRAMKKYGIENFCISIIEETDNPEEREQFWINFYDSYHNGYNATLGGDGKRLINYNEVVENYLQLKNMVEVAKKMNIHPDSVALILKEKGVKIYTSSEIIKKKYGKSIIALDKKTQDVVKQFDNMHDAAIWVNENGYSNSKLDTTRTHISEVCHNKRKTAYGFKWEFIKEEI